MTHSEGQTSGVQEGLPASQGRLPIPFQTPECSFDCCPAGEFTGALKAISAITKVEGVRGLFAGYGSFLLRDLPFDAIEFVAYEQLKKSYKASLSEPREPNSLETSCIGELAFHHSVANQISQARLICKQAMPAVLKRQVRSYPKCKADVPSG